METKALKFRGENVVFNVGPHKFSGQHQCAICRMLIPATSEMLWQDGRPWTVLCLRHAPAPKPAIDAVAEAVKVAAKAESDAEAAASRRWLFFCRVAKELNVSVEFVQAVAEQDDDPRWSPRLVERCERLLAAWSK